jgi:hypothetical protein
MGMSWRPWTKGDKATACFLILCVLVLLDRGCENAARYRCESAFDELWQQTWGQFKEEEWTKLAESMHSARRYCG